MNHYPLPILGVNLYIVTEEKVSIVAGCDDIMLAVKMLIVLMDDADLKSHVSIDYELHGEKYLLEFKKQPKTPK